MRTWTVTEAARNFSDLVSRVYYGGETALLTKGGKPVAKLTSARRAKTGNELVKLWSSLPTLRLEERAAFAKDIEAARARIPPVVSKWD